MKKKEATTVGRKESVKHCWYQIATTGEVARTVSCKTLNQQSVNRRWRWSWTVGEFVYRGRVFDSAWLLTHLRFVALQKVKLDLSLDCRSTGFRAQAFAIHRPSWIIFGVIRAFWWFLYRLTFSRSSAETSFVCIVFQNWLRIYFWKGFHSVT